MDDENHARRLCRAAQEGDRKAASELLILFHEKIYRYLRRLCGSEADAAELTQRVFCKVWASLPGFKGTAALSTWIYRIAYNVYIDWRRKADRTVSLAEAWWEALPSDAPSPFESAAEAERAARLYAIVDELDENARQAIHLHYYQDLTLRETAEILNIPTSTLKYRLRGALDAIRRAANETIHPAWKGAIND